MARGASGGKGRQPAEISELGEPLPHVLREYAFIADGERGGLIGPRGDLVWMCAPSWHDDAVFSALVGGRGSYSVAPDDPRYVWGGYYEDGSLIFRSRWATDDGIVECREALAFPGRPGTVVVLRRVIPIDGPARISARLDPRAGFGRASLRDIRCTDGVWTGRTGAMRVRWQGAPGAEAVASSGLRMTRVVPRGEHLDFVLEISAERLPRELPDADELWMETEHAWARRSPNCESSAAPRDARQAYAVLTGLTTADGGMVAASTLGLPERAEAARNYDYRYAWIRDQCYAGIAVSRLGPDALLDAAVSFVTARLLEDGPQLKPAYRTDGRPVPPERQMSRLRGYPGGTDKVGNWVNRQFQLDALGECLQLFAAAALSGGGPLSVDTSRALQVATDVIEQRWNDPDAGIWELDDEWWTHSRLECVAGLRAVARPGVSTDAGQAAEWEALADAILAETGRRSVHRSGRWQRSPTDERVDAALLMPAVRGGLGADDPRTLATYAAVDSELGRDGYVYRFRQDERPLHEAEGAFLLCGFMMSLAASQQGDAVTAGRWFERNRAACGSPGLFSEEYDVQERQLRGNLPQAFVHALLLEASIALGPNRDESGGQMSIAPGER